jgi:hypothetical protein
MRKISIFVLVTVLMILLFHCQKLSSKGIFESEVTESSAAQYSLVDFIDMAYYKSQAQANGLYFSTNTVINLSLFNLCREDDGIPGGIAHDGIRQTEEADEPDGTAGVFDTSPPTYNGNPLPTNFNGVIYCDQDIYVSGTLCEGSLTIVSNDNIMVTNSVYTCSNIGCDCKYVNLLLMCQNTFLISKYAPKVLHIDASIISRTSNWRPEDYTDSTDSDHSHPDGRGDSNPFSMDLDRDGVIGGYNWGGQANPNGDYNVGGWNEVNVLTQNNGFKVWDLEIVGAIITHSGGSASPWTTFASSSYGGHQTRHYNDDTDIMMCKPPESPHAGKWRKVSWNEEILK